MNLSHNSNAFLASRTAKASVSAVAALIVIFLLVVPGVIGFMAESRLKSATEELNGKFKTLPARLELAAFKRGWFGSEAEHSVVSPCPPNETLFKLTHRITPFPYAGLAWASIETRVELPATAPAELRELLSGSKPFVATTRVGLGGYSGQFVLPAREMREQDVIVKMGELDGQWSTGQELNFLLTLAQLGAGDTDEGATLKDIAVKSTVRPSAVKELPDSDWSLTVKSLEATGPLNFTLGGVAMTTTSRTTANEARAEVAFQVDQFRLNRAEGPVRFDKAALNFEMAGLNVPALQAYVKRVEAIDQCQPAQQQMHLAMMAFTELAGAHINSGVRAGITQASVVFPEGQVSAKAEVALAPQEAARNQPLPARLTGRVSTTLSRKVALKLMGLAPGMSPELANEQINALVQDRTLVAAGDSLSVQLVFNQSGAQLNGKDIGGVEGLMHRFQPAAVEAPMLLPPDSEAPAPTFQH